MLHFRCCFKLELVFSEAHEGDFKDCLKQFIQKCMLCAKECKAGASSTVVPGQY